MDFQLPFVRFIVSWYIPCQGIGIKRCCYLAGERELGQDSSTWVMQADVIVLCPGVHAPDLTQSFLEQFELTQIPSQKLLVFPSDRYPPYSAPDVVRFLHERLNRNSTNTWLNVPLIFVGFSAGVVGAMGAAVILQNLGCQIQAFIALDGWGVPLMGSFPTHRMSHDAFTHWSSAILGAGQDSFYADPGVGHLDLWRSPQTVNGWWMKSTTQPSTQTTALQFLSHWLHYYIQHQ